MDKLIKVIALSDEFMVKTGERFCVKGKEYPVIIQNETEYAINSELGGYSHWFDYTEPYFELVFENNIGEIYIKKDNQDLMKYRSMIKEKIEQIQIQIDDLLTML
jgi:hypothetical protein